MHHSLILSVLLLSFTNISFAKTISKLFFVRSPQLQGSLSIEIQLENGVFGKNKGDFNINGIAPRVEQEINLTRASTLSYVLKYSSSVNLEPRDLRTVEMKGKIKLASGKDKRTSVELISLDKSPKINCDNVINAGLEGNTLLIDLKKLINLSSCQGKDIAQYSDHYIGKRDVSGGKNFFSMDQDKSMGTAYANQFVREYGNLVYPANHPASRYMQEKMEVIARNSDMPNLRPTVYVINANILNAFALPGGYVFVFRGLLEQAPSEAAVMGVLGHEWAHVTARHGTKNVTRALKLIYGALALRLALYIWADVSRDTAKKILLPLIGEGTVIGAQLAVLHKGREAELEADRLGAQYALRAGYHPIGIGDMFKEFKRHSPRGSTSLEKALSSHPDHDTRIEQNANLVSLFLDPNPHYITTSERYISIIDSMKSMELVSENESILIANKFIGGLREQQNNIILERTQKFLGSQQ